MGDSVDNIPGVDKCGPKTAAKWLAEYGTLDGVIANADKIGGKIGENLRAALPRLPLNRATGHDQDRCGAGAGAATSCKLRERDVEALRELYTRYGFHAALRELEGNGGGNAGASVGSQRPEAGRPALNLHAAAPASNEALDPALSAPRASTKRC